MADPQAQTVFKRIILFNKLLPEAELDKILGESPEPVDAMKRLIDRKVLNAKQANDLYGIYTKQLEQVTGKAAGGQPAAAPPAGGPPKGGPPAGGGPPGTGGRPPVSGGPPGTAAKGGAAVARGGAGADLIHRLLKVSREARASDLHVVSGAIPVVRVGGELLDLKMSALPPDVCEKSLMALLNDDQKKKFQETNDLDFCYQGSAELGRFRANYMRQQQGVDAVFRLIPNQVPAFEALNLPPQVKTFTDYRQGIVLVTGPKGCGKTTTLAAMVGLINSTRPEHIITIEDPIEFVQPCDKAHVNQREVGTHTESFSNALRAALREAPDVIMVGEMRDLETTQLAITAAETGHLVLATLHTPDAMRTIGRVLDVFPPKEQGQIRSMVSESLRGIVSQQLVPSIDGKSTVLALEILINTPAIGNLIRDDRTFQIRGVMQTGKRLGMVLMDESLAILAKEGRISKEEALSRAEDVSFVTNELN